MIVEKEVTNGKYKLLYSKRFLLASDDPIKMRFETEDGYPFSLIFAFTTTEDKKPHLKLDTSNLDRGFEFFFTLENFNNPLGTGTINPISILSKDVDGAKKEICIGFYAFKNTDGHHIFDLEIYEEL